MKRPTLFLAAIGVLLLLGNSPSEAASYLVDRLTDANPGGGGEGSNLAGDLRFAVTHAQTGDGVTINVAGTIDLAAALPVISRNICIQGPGANLLIVQGAGGSVVSIGSGATVTLSGLTVTGGRSNGGGVFNQGTLTLNDVTIRDNTAGDPTNGEGIGAGIWNYLGATLTLNGCTVSGNTAIGNLSYAPSRGGGVENYGTLTLNNSTVSGNSAVQGTGGGISNSLGVSTLTLNNATVSGNSSPGTSGSGGIDNAGTLIAGNSIVAGNSDGDLFGNVTSEGYNLFGTTNGSGFDPTDLLGVDPLLGPLQDNGGPTATMAPLSGSPAIDRIPGTPGVNFPATDQRGVARPQGSLADSGAVEYSTAPVITSISPNSGSASGGTSVTINGLLFQDGASVTLAGIAATGVHVVSPTQITAHTPALLAGTLNDLVVVNPDTTLASLPDAWLSDFLDVPQEDVFHESVEKVFRSGITAGCGGGNYCKDAPVRRDQMAAFLLKAEHGSSYLPPSCTGVFLDVPCPGPFTDWVEQLSAESITGGCGGGNYCPDSPVTRRQMAVLLLKAEHGPGYTPPECSGVFLDVSCPSAFADWIEQLAAENITAGCGGGNYCPAGPNTRGQMAVFLAKAFHLP